MSIVKTYCNWTWSPAWSSCYLCHLNL